MGELDKDDNVTSWRLQQVETSLKEVQMTLKELTEKINSNAPLQQEVEELKKAVKKNTEDITELKAKPDREAATKWNTVVDVIFKLVVTAFATFFLIKLGIK
jgi:DNA repair exonuclease SbcCD ATPase subunit